MEQNPTPTLEERRGFLGAAAGVAIGGGMAPFVKEEAAGNCQAIARIRIPKTGELVPVIGLGTSRTFDVDPTAQNSNLVEVMKQFLAWGGSLIDSSPMYKRSEAVIGALCKTIDRSDLFYATKVWTNEGKGEGIAQMHRSEKLMGTPRFDLMQVHNLVGLDVQLETLKNWKAEGKLRYVGVTEMHNFAKVEELVSSGVLDFIQIPYSVTDRRVEERILPACIAHDIAVLVMRPFERGKLFSEVKGKELPGWAADFGAASWAQLFLKFIVGHEAVTIPIPATSKPHHVVDNMAGGVGPGLDSSARQKLIKLIGG
jgi:diketogulonate reductase-like aldo/keto reductase